MIKPGSRVLIIGCGYLGKRVGQAFLQMGCVVSATTRSAASIQHLNELGFHGIKVDLTTAAGFSSFENFDYILLCPAPTDHHDQAYQDLFDKGVGLLMNFLCFHPPKIKLLYTSSVGVYNQNNGAWVDELTPTQAQTLRQIALESAEQHVLKSPFPKVILRLGGLYGPGRNRIAAIRENKISFENAQNYINLIHINDAVKCILFLFDRDITDDVFNGVDMKPVTRKEYYETVASRLGISLQQGKLASDTIIRSESNKRCSNKKLLSLGYQFQIPTFVEGVDQILETEAREGELK